MGKARKSIAEVTQRKCSSAEQPCGARLVPSQVQLGTGQRAEPRWKQSKTKQSELACSAAR
jgi:hypothetical protein